MKKKILYIDMDNVLVDFVSGINQLDTNTQKEYEGRLDEVPHIFGLMKPMKGAIEAFQELSELFDTYILSTSPWENETALADKLNWVKKYLGKNCYKRLILSHHKNLNIGDYLIDDRTANGAGEFLGEHIHFGTERFPDWQSVVKYLKASNNINITNKELDRDIVNLHLEEIDMNPAGDDFMDAYDDDMKEWMKDRVKKNQQKDS